MPKHPAPEWTDEMGARVEHLRRELHLTQKELALKVGKDSNYLSKVERAERPPSAPLRRQIAEALGTTVEFLHTGDPGFRTREDRGRGDYPMLALLMESDDWRDAPPEVREFVKGLAQSGGDQRLGDWIDDLRQAIKDHKRGRPLSIGRDAVGREPEEDVVEPEG